MKIIGTFGLAIAASFTLMQSAQARGGGHSGGAHFSGGFAGGGHYSAPAHSYGGARSYAPRSYAGPSRNYSGAAGRYYSPRVSSMPNNHSSIATRPRYSPTTTALRNPTYVSGSRRFSGDRTAAFNTRTSRSNGQQLTPGTRTAANRSQGFNQGRVIGRHSASTWHRNWDHGHDHSWHGHRCHFHNGFWFIYDPFLWYPYGYGYGYYPYDSYYDSSYYDSSYYDDGSHPVNEYAPGPATTQSEYSGDARVSDVQSALAREGYYDGAVDGVLGPGTRRALRNYQRDHHLDVTGGISHGVIEALRLR